MIPALRHNGREIELFIFDFDGTIAYTSLLHKKAFEQTLDQYNCSVDYDAIAGMTTESALRLVLSSHCGTVSDSVICSLAQRKRELVRDLILKQLLPIPAVDNFLRFAKSHVKMSLATSGSRLTVELALAKLGYVDWFDPFICGDDVPQGKPDPGIFLKVLAKVGCSSERALVFEDSAAGFIAAERAGLDYIDVRGFNWDASKFK